MSQIKEKIKAANAEIAEMTEKRNVTSDPTVDKLTLFRQQAAIISRKKESTAERLNDTRGEVANVEEEVRGATRLPDGKKRHVSYWGNRAGCQRFAQNTG